MGSAKTDMLQGAEAIARLAGSAILDIYAKEFTVVEKSDASPLTAADMAAHAVIAIGLHSLTPDIPLLSEEDVAGFAGPNANDCVWLVDPLDGTKEFIKRNGEFTVNIALIEAGRAVLGVVYAPVMDVMYLGGNGVGAWRIDASGKQALQVSKQTAGSALRIIGSRLHAAEEMAAWLQSLAVPYEFLAAGSSLKFCRVAEGAADIYPRFGPTSQWDTAAGQCVLEAAGGAVFSVDGETLRYGAYRSLLNPQFFTCEEGYEDLCQRSSGVWRRPASANFLGVT